MTTLFTESEKALLFERQLAKPSVNAALKDLDGAVLFGAGNFGRMILGRMRQQGLAPSFFIDNNAANIGKEIEGVAVKSASALASVGDSLVVITSSFFQPMVQDCLQAGVRRWTLFSNIEELFGHLTVISPAQDVVNNPEANRLAALLQNSPKSLKVLREVLSARITGGTVPYVDDQYFVEGVIPDLFYSNFVDCGAFNGDTLAEWIKRKSSKFSAASISYDAFEPEPVNYQDLKSNLLKLPAELVAKVQVHNAAVGAEAGTLHFLPAAAGSIGVSSSGLGQAVPVVTLDSVLGNRKVTFIKMDVESFELKALEGARKLITSQRPALAIANYHLTEHIWQIPLWIHDLNLGYKVEILQHCPTFGETVCYAIPQ